MTTTARNRLLWLDFARVIAAVAIIWLHTPQSAAMKPTIVVTRFAVPFFAAAAAFMACRIGQGALDKSIRSFAAARFSRIYLPFLGWSAIYFLVRWMASQFIPSTRTPPIGWYLLWQGPASHLWFLPFVLAITIVGNLLGRMLTKASGLRIPAIVSLIAVAAACCMTDPQTTASLPYTPRLAFDALPATCLGLALAIVCSIFNRDWLSRPVTSVAALAAFIALQATLAVTGRHIVTENLAGVALLLACFAAWKWTWMNVLPTLGAMAYGVYLSHLLFIQGLQDVYASLSIPVSPVADITVFAMSVIGAFALTAALQRSPLTRWLVP